MAYIRVWIVNIICSFEESQMINHMADNRSCLLPINLKRFATEYFNWIECFPFSIAIVSMQSTFHTKDSCTHVHRDIILKSMKCSTSQWLNYGNWGRIDCLLYWMWVKNQNWIWFCCTVKWHAFLTLWFISCDNMGPCECVCVPIYVFSFSNSTFKCDALSFCSGFVFQLSMYSSIFVL